MAKKVLLYCEKCKKETEHWDNRLTKKGKQPDYKCCDKACGNGIWESSSKVKPKEVTKTSTKSNYSKSYNNSDNVPQSMFGAWAKDLAIVCVKEGLDKEEVLNTFKFFLPAVKSALNGTQASVESVEQEDKEVSLPDDEEETQGIEVGENDFADLDDL